MPLNLRPVPFFVSTLCLLLIATSDLHAQPNPCYGDCNGDEIVTVSDVITAVNVNLGSQPLSACPSLIRPPDIQDLILAVRNVLYSCSGASEYALADGSMLTTFAEPENGTPRPTSVALTGSISVASGPAGPPNTIFLLNILRVDLVGGDSVVRGGAPQELSCDGSFGYGCIQALTFDPPNTLHGSAKLYVNAKQIGFVGAGNYMGSPPFPTIQALRMCGGASDRAILCSDLDAGLETGYALTLYATPPAGGTNR